VKLNATAIQQHQAARLLTRHYNETGRNILGDGLKLCQRAKAHNSITPDTAIIGVEKKAIKRKISEKQYVTEIVNVATMRDVARCGNAHLCPHCSSSGAAKMRDWITNGFHPACVKHNLHYSLMTFTAHHRRDCDWSKSVDDFYASLEDFSIAMYREFKRVGSFGRVRAMECPVGSNGLHLHIHDLITHAPGTDLAKFQKLALAKWKAALKKNGLRCTSRGIDIIKYGDFNPCYIAKEMAAHDTKKESKSDLKNLFELLSQSAIGNKQAGDDWLRAAKAIQGRDRWNVGQLATKLGIPCPSDWKQPEGVAKTDDDPALIITYPQTHHMIATSPNNGRAGLAFILRAARNEKNHPGKTERMVLRMCDETIKCEIDLIKLRHAKKFNNSINSSTTFEQKQNIAAKQAAHCTFAIAEYRATTYNYMYPAPAPIAAPAPELEKLAFGGDVNFD